MASLGLKLFYLRTREKKLSQRDVAEQLGIRQGTLSFLEQGANMPQWPLVVNLCKFYDVTPTYLADDDRGVVPRPTERWNLRDALLTLGMSVEIPASAVEETEDGTLLCELRPGAPFFDADAAVVRRRHARERGSRRALEELRTRHRAEESELERELARELAEHPSRRRGPDPS